LVTPYESIDRVEDRERFTKVLNKLEIPQADYGIAYSYEEAHIAAERIGFPVLVRPSYVLGGRAMEIVYDNNELREYMARSSTHIPEHPILVDKFLEDAIEIDVDALSDGEDVFIGGTWNTSRKQGCTLETLPVLYPTKHS
jgi:carbamoyl-phosphate synthase large subunit